MTKLVKMEWYKLRTSKLFIILVSVVFGINAIAAAAIPLVLKAFAPNGPIDPTALSDAFASPWVISFLLIAVFISAASYLYSDFSGGYVKNIAGQVGDRGKLVIAKFITVGIHNFIFFFAAAASHALGAAVAGQLTVDGDLFGGVMTFLLKWLLSMALTAIVMFFAVGVRNKTLAAISGVVLATGSLSLVYLGIDTAISNIFKVSGFSIGNYLPDSLMGSVSVQSNDLVINGVIVAVLFIAAFTVLTYMTFKKRDVK